MSRGGRSGMGRGFTPLLKTVTIQNLEIASSWNFPFNICRPRNGRGGTPVHPMVENPKERNFMEMHQTGTAQHTHRTCLGAPPGDTLKETERNL